MNPSLHQSPLLEVCTETWLLPRAPELLKVVTKSAAGLISKAAPCTLPNTPRDIMTKQQTWTIWGTHSRVFHYLQACRTLSWESIFATVSLISCRTWPWITEAPWGGDRRLQWPKISWRRQDSDHTSRANRERVPWGMGLWQGLHTLGHWEDPIGSEIWGPFRSPLAPS